MNRRPLAALLLAATAACTLLEDNATHLAHELEDAVQAMRASGATEKVLRYEPLGKRGQAYTIEFAQSRRPTQVDSFGNVTQSGGGYLVVTGDHRGGTSYHERFVMAPRAIRHEVAAGQVAEIVLKRVDDRIVVTDVHSVAR